MRQESQFQPRAVSSVGAAGLMQIMADTARWVSISGLECVCPALGEYARIFDYY